MLGKIVDIEAIDGGGGETQKIKLRDYLKSRKLNPFVISYPDYQGPFGEKLRNFLDHKVNYTAEEQFFLFSADMIKDEDKLTAAVQNGRIVVRESGPNRTCAYQSAGGYDLEKMVGYQKKFQVPADLVIYIDITPEEGVRRKMGDNEAPDRFEKDMRYLSSVREAYQNLCKRGELGKKYVIIDGMKSIEQVHGEIVRNVESLLA